jgi:hypothetical protein
MNTLFAVILALASFSFTLPLTAMVQEGAGLEFGPIRKDLNIRALNYRIMQPNDYFGYIKRFYDEQHRKDGNNQNVDDRDYFHFEGDILKPMEMIISLWKGGKIPFENDLYWFLRDIIENNLYTLVIAAEDDVNLAASLFDDFALPLSVRLGLMKLIGDYYSRFEANFWDHHFYLGTTLYLKRCEYLSGFYLNTVFGEDY